MKKAKAENKICKNSKIRTRFFSLMGPSHKIIRLIKVKLVNCDFVFETLTSFESLNVFATNIQNLPNMVAFFESYSNVLLFKQSVAESYLQQNRVNY